MVCHSEPHRDLRARSLYPYFFMMCFIFLVMTFLGFVALPKIGNIHGVIIMCHVTSLAAMYISLGTIHLRSRVTVEPNSKIAYKVFGSLKEKRLGCFKNSNLQL